MSGRLDKVNQQLRREISAIIQQDLADPRLQFVSITRVDVSPDLRNSKVYFSVLGDAKQIEDAITSLKRTEGIVRRHLGQRVKMRYIPEVHFVYDKSIAMSAQIEETIKELKGEHTEEDLGNH